MYIWSVLLGSTTEVVEMGGGGIPGGSGFGNLLATAEEADVEEAASAPPGTDSHFMSASSLVVVVL